MEPVVLWPTGVSVVVVRVVVRIVGVLLVVMARGGFSFPRVLPVVVVRVSVSLVLRAFVRMGFVFVPSMEVPFQRLVALGIQGGSLSLLHILSMDVPCMVVVIRGCSLALTLPFSHGVQEAGPRGG
ncbi:MAG: hypothetical protein ACM3ST_04005 [Bdellovibrio bacteriovorus]